jgi:hypothetical protein
MKLEQLKKFLAINNTFNTHKFASAYIPASVLGREEGAMISGNINIILDAVSKFSLNKVFLNFFIDEKQMHDYLTGKKHKRNKQK